MMHNLQCACLYLWKFNDFFCQIEMCRSIFMEILRVFLFCHRGFGASGRHPHGQVRQRFAAHFARHFERCFVIAKA